MAEKKSRGRPSTLTKSHIIDMMAAYASGATDREVAALLGISERHLYWLKEKKEELSHAISVMKGAPNLKVEATMFKRATGYEYDEEVLFTRYDAKQKKLVVQRERREVHVPGEVRAGMFWLSNRAPEKWRMHHKSDTEVSPQMKDVGPAPKKSFEEFCETASYPRPFEKQVEFMKFAMEETEVRLILGSRGYGKTDYAVIMGLAYEIYMEWPNPTTTTLIITKSRERNAALIHEIQTACEKNGVEFDQANSNHLKVRGHIGKDHSVSTVTIKTVSLRGRHPKRVIMDDPVTEDDTSEATRTLVEKKYNEVHKLCSNILIIGQPAHKFDLYAKLRGILKKMEVPWGSIPELDADLDAQMKAGVSEASISASYHLKILAEGATPFDTIRYADAFPAGNGTSVAFIDPASEGTDDTAIAIMKMVGDALFVVGFKWRKAWNHCLDDIAPLLTRYGVAKLCFETNSLGNQPLDILRKVFGSSGVVGKKSISNKHSKIMAAGAYAHMIHLCRDSGPGFIDQVIQYEYGVKHDDAPDAMASCMEWIGLIRGRQ